MSFISNMFQNKYGDRLIRLITKIGFRLLTDNRFQIFSDYTTLVNTKNATKNFDYTTIADRLRTVSWGNDSHPAGVVKPVYGIPTFQLTAKAV